MGGGHSSIPADKRIVIVGGGYGGVHLAQVLIKLNANVTLIDLKDCFQHNVAAVRTVVDESYASKMWIPYKPTFGDKFCQGKVVKIDPKAKTLQLEDGQIIAYDILVIATGSFGPMKEYTPEREKSIAIYSNYADAVRKSQKIVLIGGGAVGIETACEIKTDFPDKEVTVIHGGAQPVLDTAPSNFLCRIKCLLKQLNVNILYEERAQNIDDIQSAIPGSYEIKTDKGTVLKADLVFKTTGLKVNKSAYENSLADAIDERGALKVNEFFQVKGQTDIFAIGDCNDVKTIKLAYVTNLQADLLAANLSKLLNNQEMNPWSSSYITYLMALAMGRHHGVGCTVGGWMLPEFAVVYSKSKDLMLGRFYAEMNQQVPK